MRRPGLYRDVARPALFRLPAESAHHLTTSGLAAVSRLAPAVPSRRRPPSAAGGMEGQDGVDVLGIRFPSRVGLAAGLDKDGVALRAWPLLGFGFVEVGTVTARPQPGNPQPRLFRLRGDAAIVNRMGFNNAGAAALAVRLDRLGQLPVPLGISLGKSKVTPVDDAIDDYLTSLRLLHRHADYVAVNVSSPNTPGLRSLQDAAALADLVAALVAETRVLAGAHGHPAPLLVKVAPDLTNDALAELVEVCLTHGVSGLIATNTTLDRSALTHPDPQAAEAGGLSGPPLLRRSLDVVSRIRVQAGDRLAVIGVGGISRADDALRMVDAGASLVQLYTALVYQGPVVVRQINDALNQRQHSTGERS